MRNIVAVASFAPVCVASILHHAFPRHRGLLRLDYSCQRASAILHAHAEHERAAVVGILAIWALTAHVSNENALVVIQSIVVGLGTKFTVDKLWLSCLCCRLLSCVYAPAHCVFHIITIRCIVQHWLKLYTKRHRTRI